MDTRSLAKETLAKRIAGEIVLSVEAGKVIKKWRPSNSEVVHQLMNLDLPIRFRKYVLAIAHRNGQSELKGRVGKEIANLLCSSEKEEILGGIWLVGELQLSLANHSLEPEIETICLMASQEHSFLSSSVLKEIAMNGGSIAHMAPPCVVEAFAKQSMLDEDGNSRVKIVSVRD